MKKHLLISSCLFIGVTALGQTSVNTSGGAISNDSGSISYSIGQVVFQSNANSSGSVSQGVQQAFSISSLDLEENKFHFSLSTYPNPTLGQLNLHVGNFNQEKLYYVLVDAQGKILEQGEILAQETMLDLHQLPMATYFVEVHHAGKKVQTFKISKN